MKKKYIYDEWDMPPDFDSYNEEMHTNAFLKGLSLFALALLAIYLIYCQ